MINKATKNLKLIILIKLNNLNIYIENWRN